MSTSETTREQNKIAESYSKTFGVAKEHLLFLNEKDPTEPWPITAALIELARKSPLVQTVSEQFDSFIQPLQQIVHTASVTLVNGQTWIRSGVATIGECIPGSDKPADPHQLAGARAVRNTLVAAGIEPVKLSIQKEAPSPFKPFATFADQEQEQVNVDDANQRNKDLARIHILAEQAELITRDGDKIRPEKYQGWIREHFKVGSAGFLDFQGRASVINALEQLVIERNV